MAKKQISTYKFVPGAVPPAYNEFPNAVALLVANRAYLLEEIDAYITAEILATNPIYSGYVYDSIRQQKCKRDIGYILDGFIYDLTYGGNTLTYQVASRFYVNGIIQIIQPAVEIDTKTWLLDKIVTEILPEVVGTPLNLTLTQTTIVGVVAEAGAASVVTTLMGIVTSVITDGLSSLPKPLIPNQQGGGLMPNTVALLELNKRFIQEETIAYIQYNVENNIPPYTFYTYNAEKCRRDVSYVLEGYLTDLRNGGNRQTVFNAEKYFENGVPQVDGDRLPEVFAHTFIRNLIQNFILPNIAFASLQTTVGQTISNSITAESTGFVNIAVLADTIINVIIYGLTELPASLSNRGYLKIPGYFKLKDFLLISNASRNIILYNFADPTSPAEITYSENFDSDFAGALFGVDKITTVTLNLDTTGMMVTDNIQIFVEGKEQAVRLNPIATDAMERMKVGIPQSMLDADFEYGLQPTKWQAISMMRGYPSIYEIPGSDIAVLSVVTDASQSTGGSGASQLTVTTQSAHGLLPNDPITIKALANSISGFSRAEGSFLVSSVTTNTFTYFAKSKVGSTAGQQLSSTYTQLRRGGFYTGSAIGTPAFSVASAGSSGSITTSLITVAGSDVIGFTGVVPTVGSPISGTGINVGTQITAVTGAGGTVATTPLTINADISDTNIVVDSTIGISAGLVFDRGDGQAVVVTGVSGNNVSLSGGLTSKIIGRTEVFSNVAASGGDGTAASFNINRNGLDYAAIIAVPGTGYAAGNTLTALGTSLGGTSPANNATITVNTASNKNTVSTLFNVTLTPGAGYITSTSRATTVSPSGGTGLTVDIVDNGTGGVSSVSVNTPGQNYAPGDLVSITNALPEGGVLTFNNTSFSSGVGHTTRTNVATTTNGFGTGLTVDVTANGSNVLTSVIINNPGSGYAIGDNVVIPPTVVGAVQTINVGSIVPGTGYASATNVATTGGSGTGLTVNIDIDGGGGVVSVTVNQRGSGYSTAPTPITITGGGGNATFTIDTISTTAGINVGTVAVTSTIQVATVNAGGVIQTVSISGTPVTVSTVDFISAVTINDPVTSNIASGNTGISYSAIATIQIAFTSPHGFIPGNTITTLITSSGTGAQLAAGPYFVEQVPSANILRYTARAAGVIDNTLAGVVYGRPDGFFVHRPFDGGVQLGTASPSHGATAIRMSKKYIRYQSGKGVMYNTGALFAPSYDIRNITASGTAVGSVVTVTTDDTDHGLQVSGVVNIRGVISSGFNGTYTVTDIVNERVFRILAQQTLSTTTAILGSPCYVSIQKWHGSTIRSGIFDDQNGMFWQYDGIRMAVVKRSSTNQLAGTITIAANSNIVTGSNTRFIEQLAQGDRIVIRGMSHVVSQVTSNTLMSVTPDFRGVNDVVDAKCVKTIDLIVPQEYWNMDTLNGAGPSGYNIDVTKMQMIGIQHTWYGAGFIDFMLRGPDGNYVFAHRFRNSNFNTEAYMRTGNQPVRYEVINEGAKGKLTAAMNSTQTTIPLSADDAFYFPSDGTVIVDNELIRFTGNNGTSLTGCVRAAPLTQFTAGAQRNFTGGIAATHAFNAGVVLVSNTITPNISHWGSAFMIDGQFDSDRGYLFNYAATAIPATLDKTTAFLIRLAPSVSNAQIGDLGDKELLNRAQLLLSGIAVTSDPVTSTDPFVGNSWSSGGSAISGSYYTHTSADVKNWYQATSTGTFSATAPTFTSGTGASGTFGVSLSFAGATPNNDGAIVVEGVLNPSNYPTDPTKITWTGLASSAAGGQPSFAQIAAGGSVTWSGGASTSNATVQGTFTNTIVARSFAPVTATLTAIGFNAVNQTATATSFSSATSPTYNAALSTGRSDFLIPQSALDSINASTPLEVNDTVIVTGSTNLASVSITGVSFNVTITGVAPNQTYTVTSGTPPVLGMQITVSGATNSAVFVNTINAGVFTLSGNPNRINGTNIACTGQIFTCASNQLFTNETVRISGNFSGTGSITGYANPTTYFIIFTNGSTNFLLSTIAGGVPVVTTAGTPTGLTYALTSFISTNRTITAVVPNFITLAAVSYAQIALNSPPNLSSTAAQANGSNNVTVQFTSTRVAAYNSAISAARTDFLITQTQFAGLVLNAADVLSAATVITGGQTISSTTANFITISGVSYARIVMTGPGSSSSAAGAGNNVTVTSTSAATATYGSALSSGRTDFLITDASFVGTGIAVGDPLSLATFITGGQTISSITNNFITIGGTPHTRIVMSAPANSTSTSGAGQNQTVTVTASGSAASYNTTNFLFFTGASWLASGATVGTRVSTAFTRFPAGTAVAQLATRTFGGTTVYRVTFTQTSNGAIPAGETPTFQFGAQYALPGEQVFSFISNPGNSSELSLEALKELTATAIGGRGTFPNGPDVLAINVYKVAGSATPSNLILRWGEAQA